MESMKHKMLPGKLRKLRLILKYPGAQSFADLRCIAKRLKLPRSCLVPAARPLAPTASMIGWIN